MKTLPSTLTPEAIITDFHPVGSRSRELLLRHGERVGRKALEILDRAPWLAADREFVIASAMLHDVGIGLTHCPDLGCTGRLPYVCHGVAGRRILDELGLQRHALVCERHVGVGISAEQAQRQCAALPARDMLPLSLEERLICYADKFFSKTDNGRHEKTPAEIIAGLMRYDADGANRFLALQRLFSTAPDVPAASVDTITAPV
jgi:uncharacterized protein